MNDYVVYRWTLDNIKQYLKVREKTTTVITPRKIFMGGHGSLTNTASGGGGYHGRCSNCGLALVTDLGYTSWDDTICEIKHDKTVTSTFKLTWQKTIDKGTRLTEAQAHRHHGDQRDAQGWGKYNFGYNKPQDITNF